MVSKEILKKVKKIQLKILRMSTDVMSGSYVSAFKGMGIEFNEVREYIPGDDIRSIDWNVTARSHTAYVKKFVEERELTLILMVDVSASQRFGSTVALKNELAAEISALFAFLAIKNNDKVGLLLFSDTGEKYLKPQKGRVHVLRVIREILGHTPKNSGTNIAQAANFINKVINHRSIVFLVSDFLDSQYEKALKSLARRHDLVAVRITDPRELELPPVGLVEFQDAETGAYHLIDTSSNKLQEEIRQKALENYQKTAGILKAAKIDVIEIATDQPYIEPLQKFFIKRMRRRR
ncbi:MAG: DUF58 domain-containing protein [Firmicutes bacterium]|nr:DUF58 domain-containing protein [Bacillota bacterium]